MDVILWQFFFDAGRGACRRTNALDGAPQVVIRDPQRALLEIRKTPYTKNQFLGDAVCYVYEETVRNLSKC
jgi:hypothetical protein